MLNRAWGFFYSHKCSKNVDFLSGVWYNTDKITDGGMEMSENKTYIAIDLKSFYASVEAMERNLDPMKTNLVVADLSRTEKTICLAVSPSLKAYGIPGRARLFEVIQQVKMVNNQRRMKAPDKKFTGKSFDADELAANPSLELDYIVATPQMGYYIEYSGRILQVYLRHVAPEDIHVYSIDEVFIDATNYLKTNGMTGHEFARMLIREVLAETGVTATAGVGTNLYLCKIAMDITAKHIPADKDGVRIAELDEMSYRRKLWNHRPLTDFWRVGRGISQKLEQYGMLTMGDVARCSIQNEDLLYKLFGINAELLIDHAWGWEPCTIAEIKAYRPSTNCLSTGQVLQEPYPFEKARLVACEMADNLALDLVAKKLVTDQIVLVIGYDIENLKGGSSYGGEIKTDFYGRAVPKHARGTANIGRQTSSAKLITEAVTRVFDECVEKNLTVRRINITANHVVRECDVKSDSEPEQLNFFEDYEEKERRRAAENAALEKEHRMQETLVDLKKKYGKNAVLKGMNFKEGATARDRNRQIGGHKA